MGASTQLLERLVPAIERIATAAERKAQATERKAQATERIAQVLEQVISSPELKSALTSINRLADHLAPPPQSIVGTPYVAKQLGYTKVWVAELVRKGQIPQHCIVPGTGSGKVWRFYREKIDRWIESR